MNSEWLRTLVAIVDEGSFDAAADELGITASAVSQRVRALENRVGRAVVVRTLPCRPTPAGEQLLRLARQVLLLQDETLGALSGAAGPTVLRLAVNADSLATWLRPLLVEAAAWDDVVLRLSVEDQDRSARLLRTGDVVGAVTAEPRPAAGCRTEPLGTMRYLPCATPTLRDRHARDGVVDLAAMPVLRYNVDDDLQLEFLRRRGVTPTRQAQVPGSEAFVAAILAGLAWGLVPELQLDGALADGRLVLLSDEVVEVELYWQQWSIASPLVDRAAEAVRRAASVLRA